MPHHHGEKHNPQVIAALEEALKQAFPDGDIEVSGGGGHYSLSVASAAFAGKNVVGKQRLVYKAIGELMAGDDAPVHAVDAMQTVEK